MRIINLKVTQVSFKVLDVDINNKKFVFRCIEKVIKSYSSKKVNDQLIIQEMVKSINTSVNFYKDIETGTDYYVINYDDIIGKPIQQHQDRYLFK